jgi:hypothetical protein
MIHGLTTLRNSPIRQLFSYRLSDRPFQGGEPGDNGSALLVVFHPPVDLFRERAWEEADFALGGVIHFAFSML